MISLCFKSFAITMNMIVTVIMILEKIFLNDKGYLCGHHPFVVHSVYIELYLACHIRTQVVPCFRINTLYMEQSDDIHTQV